MISVYPIFILLFVFTAGCNFNTCESPKETADRSSKGIEYEINRSVITFRIAFHLIDRDLPWEPRPNPVRKDLMEYFSDHKDHEVVAAIEEFSYDDVITAYLLHKQEFPGFGDRYDLSEMKKTYTFFGLTGIEPKLDSLYVKLFEFYNEANVKEFIAKNLGYYEGAMEEISRIAKEYDFVTQLEEYTNQSNDRYVISPEPLFLTGGTRGIGPTVKTDSISYVYQFISPSDKIDLGSTPLDSLKKQYGYIDNDYIRRISVHEFGHSFVNSAFYNSEMANYIESRDSLFTDEIKKLIKYRGIGNFQTYLIEHVVRLLEIRIAAIYLGEQEAQILRDENSMFIYLPEMEKKVISQFEANRNQYSTYKDFIPELIRVIE